MTETTFLSQRDERRQSSHLSCSWQSPHLAEDVASHLTGPGTDGEGVAHSTTGSANGDATWASFPPAPRLLPGLTSHLAAGCSCHLTLTAVPDGRKQGGRSCRWPSCTAVPPWTLLSPRWPRPHVGTSCSGRTPQARPAGRASWGHEPAGALGFHAQGPETWVELTWPESAETLSK